jgi:hypothetical protein
LAVAKRHNNALSRLDRVVTAAAESRPDLTFLPYVRKLIAAHRPGNLSWVCPGNPPPECRSEDAPKMPVRSVEDVRPPSRSRPGLPEAGSTAI